MAVAGPARWRSATVVLERDPAIGWRGRRL